MTNFRYSRRWLRTALAAICLLAAVVALSSCPQTRDAQTTGLTASSSESPALPNFAQVTKDLFRGGQPTAGGFKQLKEMGIKTVVNLRSAGSDRSRMKGLGMYCLDIPSEPWDPDDESMILFLRLMREEKYLPVFVHCQYGSDRTGVTVAVYRVVQESWPREQAIAEMEKYGLHTAWVMLKDYIRNLDVEKMKKAVDAAPAPVPELVE